MTQQNTDTEAFTMTVWEADSELVTLTIERGESTVALVEVTPDLEIKIVQGRRMWFCSIQEILDWTRILLRCRLTVRDYFTRLREQGVLPPEAPPKDAN